MVGWPGHALRRKLAVAEKELTDERIATASLRAHLEAKTSLVERLELELARLQDDFKGLVAITTGRIPPRLKPEFEKDLFAEQTDQEVVYLSPNTEMELGITLAEEYTSKPDGESEAGESN